MSKKYSILSNHSDQLITAKETGGAGDYEIGILDQQRLLLVLILRFPHH